MKIISLINKINSLYKAHKELISYLIFGALTTIVSYISYAIFSRFLGIAVVNANVLSWIFSVLFAYITNRLFVFESKKHGTVLVLKEMLSFFASRLLSGAIETLLLFIFADLLGYNDLIVKALATIIVIVLNYIFSKLFVFKSQSKSR